MRVFEPASEFLPGGRHRTGVRRWTWTRGGGLLVEYLDGFVTRSAWRSLGELLLAAREGREVAVREIALG